MLGAFRAAREAYEEEEKVLDLQPQRMDAGLIVGTYRYIVAALSLPLRMVAYVAGFGGGKEKGIKQIEDAAAYGGDNQTEARFALILLYNREKRYDEALKVLATLRDRYPRNRLVWLESGSTSLRAGRAAEAERFLSDGLSRFAEDTRPRMFGEDALWRYKRGAALAALGRPRSRGRVEEGAGARSPEMGSRPQPSRARQAGAQGRQQGGRGRRASRGDSACRERQRSADRRRGPASAQTALNQADEPSSSE